MRTTKEKKVALNKVSQQGFMPHGSKKLVNVKLKPSKLRTSMREKALVFYQSCFISTRKILRKLVSAL